MEDLSILKRAKEYIDKLARGINPLTDEDAEDDTLVNNVRITRCFFYISDVLGKVIENGGEIGKKKRAEKVEKVGLFEFALTDEQKASVKLSREPLAITNFVALINEVIDTATHKKLSYRTVVSHLLEEGYLMVREESDGETKVPTEKGYALGIMRERKDYDGRFYYVNLYSENAQSYILENINEM